jgi:hypothetical protein
MEKLQTLDEFLSIWQTEQLHPELPLLVESLIGMPTGYNKDTEVIINSITAKLPENREYSTMEVLYSLLDNKSECWKPMFIDFPQARIPFFLDIKIHD